MRVRYEIYGCAVMKGEALNALEELRRKGVEVSEEGGDVAIIFTCTVRSETEQRMLSRIERLREEHQRVIVTGCLASAQPGLIKKMFPDVSIVSNGQMHKLYDAVIGKEMYLLGYERPRDWLREPPKGEILVVPVADGCLGNCTFCITKAARPILRSQSPSSIIDYIKKGIEKGAKEIWLTAPDLAAYGRDIGITLVDLLDKVLRTIPEDVKIRIGMMNPDTFEEIMDELMELMSDKRVYKFFHLPLQSGSNRMLKLMGRKYTYEQYREIVEKVRRKFVDPTIATDILIGFPGEEEEDFQLTLKAIREMAFERVHMAAYTPRPLTIGARMRQVREDVKSKRVKIAYSLMMKVGEEVHKRYLGGIFKARVSEFDEKYSTFVARLHNYVPVVLKGNLKIGEEARVKITDYTFYDLRGEVIR
ncbi:2-methylthioadenine synthetase [Ignicoccus pacificus DSM 13166]|uniref:tRNA-t(6)A37 methylthiotransferase n=1 Tax=Ignicoccus pacificus DSM 13166 TaxID=940294 RepID=A0A977K9T2_9CREN|nr:2-methylthioadenine synthetase [Ignicoccus pacificus DSM 13166]